MYVQPLPVYNTALPVSTLITHMWWGELGYQSDSVSRHSWPKALGTKNFSVLFYYKTGQIEYQANKNSTLYNLQGGPWWVAYGLIHVARIWAMVKCQR